jgi:hypothetical protein
VFNTAVVNGPGQIPQIQMAVDFCATAGSDNCSGGGGGGLWNTLGSNFTAGSFLLDFDGQATFNETQITLSDFYVRFQSVGYYGDTSGSDTGTTVSVPGPIVGAGLPGLVAALGGMYGLNFYRRRRNNSHLPA